MTVIGQKRKSKAELCVHPASVESILDAAKWVTANAKGESTHMKVLGGLIAALTWYLYIILAKSSGPVSRWEDALLWAVPVVPLVLVLWAAMRRSERGEKTAAVWLLAAAPLVSVLALVCFFAVVHSISK